MRPKVLKNLAKVRVAASYRCAAHMYRAFASGHAHFVMMDRLSPWDHLAGRLIATEAGAHVVEMVLGLPSAKLYSAHKRTFLRSATGH